MLLSSPSADFRLISSKLLLTGQLLFCAMSVDFKPSFRGPRKTLALWGEEEQRNERALGLTDGSEGYEACDDERPLAVLPSSPRDNQFLEYRTRSLWSGFFFCTGGIAFKPSFPGI